MKMLRTIGILALVAGLLLGGVGSAFAKGPPDEPRGGGPHSPGKRGLFGTVTSATVTDNVTLFIELETKLEGVVETVHITANVTAKYMVPRETHGPQGLAKFIEIVDENKDGDLDELEGRRLAVLVTFTNTSTADAIRLMLIPDGPPLHAHRVGVVVDTFVAGESDKIIIKDRDGESHEFKVSEDTIYRPADIDPSEDIVEGKYVTVVVKGGPKAGPIAKAIVLHEKTED